MGGLSSIGARLFHGSLVSPYMLLGEKGTGRENQSFAVGDPMLLRLLDSHLG